MNADQLREAFPNESACRKFFEAVIWSNGRVCPHCSCGKSYHIKGASVRPGLYECDKCKRQFSVTTRTPMHSTKLRLWTWLQAMYFLVNSSKGVSSVFLGKWIGVSQKTAWRMGHAIRQMMAPGAEPQPILKGIVELDEKFLGGKPRHQQGVHHKRGKGTDKQCVFVAVERQGAVRSVPVESDKTAILSPIVAQYVQKEAHLMSDQNPAYRRIGTAYACHESVNHGTKEYVRGEVHNNTAESFNSLLERAKIGVFHYMSEGHLPKYLNEISFRWNHRTPKEIVTNSGKKKTVMVPLPVIALLKAVLAKARGRQLRRTKNGGIMCFASESGAVA
jgi:transposase-like protein